MKPVVIIGAGGHAKVLLEALRASNHSICGLCDSKPENAKKLMPHETILGDDNAALALPDEEILVVIGVGASSDKIIRQELFSRYRDAGFEIATVIHPSAVIASDITLGKGVQIMAGAIIQPGVTIGDNSVINTRTSIDHDCQIGHHAFIQPGATLCGGVQVGDASYIGAGATVLEYRSIGADTTIGSGALVNRDIKDGITAIGVPAKPAQK